MPWCESCDRYHAPSALSGEGTCPVCGGPVSESTVQADQAEAAAAQAHAKIPWHFWLLLVAATLYLGWRLIQGLIALAGLA